MHLEMRSDDRRRNRILLGSALVLLISSIVLGGSASYVPLLEMLVEWTAIAVLILWMWIGRFRPTFGAALLILSVVAIPLMQLVPLPPSIWTRLPGTDAVVAIDAAVGIDPWRPLSINPDATLRSAVSTLPFITMILITASLVDRDRRILLWGFVTLAAVGLVLGMVQMIGRDSHAYIFLNNSFGLPLGFFANRNHQGTFLALAAVAALSLCETAGGGRLAPARIWGGALAAAFGAGVVATGSRAASAMLVIGCLASILSEIALATKWRRNVPHTLAAFTIGIVTLSAVLALVAQTGAVEHLVHRLTTIDDRSRIEIWQGAWAAILAHFPTGSGMGNFVLAHHAVEQLDHVSSHYANRAHNDYLEFLVEAGLVAVLAICGAVLLLALAEVRTYRQGDRIRRFAIIGIVLLLLHSLVDYPLRTFALSATLGMFVGLLMTRRTDGDVSAHPRRN
ncbi:O-antigen ligase family protein [Sphingomonas sp. R86520]|uniref:O-antigen ligase family protein n=1 Tax=Sphingomonas sp. R86520 TaxID=3093859 RepID=UPI0036D41F77